MSTLKHIFETIKTNGQEVLITVYDYSSLGVWSTLNKPLEMIYLSEKTE